MSERNPNEPKPKAPFIRGVEWGFSVSQPFYGWLAAKLLITAAAGGTFYTLHFIRDEYGTVGLVVAIAVAAWIFCWPKGTER